MSNKQLDDSDIKETIKNGLRYYQDVNVKKPCSSPTGKELRCHCSHSYNKKTVNKLKINDYSQTHQRTEVIRLTTTSKNLEIGCYSRIVFPIYVEILILSSLKCDLIWRQHLYRVNQVEIRSLRVGPNPIYLQYREKEAHKDSRKTQNEYNPQAQELEITRSQARGKEKAVCHSPQEKNNLIIGVSLVSSKNHIERLKDRIIFKRI